MAHVSIRVVPLLDLSTLMAKWVGLGPAWSFELLLVEFTMSTIEGQLNGSSAVPDDANDVLQDALRQKWMLWSREGSCPVGDLEPLTYLTAGRRGQHCLAQQESESVMLIPTGSTYVFDQIEDRIPAMVFHETPSCPDGSANRRISTIRPPHQPTGPALGWGRFICS